jgi:hypothetical protein
MKAANGFGPQMSQITADGSQFDFDGASRHLAIVCSNNQNL